VPSWSARVPGAHRDSTRPFHPPAPDPGVVRALRGLLRDLRPDVVHGHTWMLTSFLALRPARHVRVVRTLHDHGAVCAKRTLLRDGAICDGPGTRCFPCASTQYGAVRAGAIVAGLRVSRVLERRVDHYVAISRTVADAAVTVTDGRPVSIIPPFVADDLATRAPDRPRPRFLPPDDGYVLYVGDLSRHKGVDVLLEADRLLGHRVPIVMIGRPARDWDRPPRSPSVTLVPGAAHDDVMAAWRRSALGVVPSVWPEPFGLVAVEAMRCGKPVVASRTGGLVDIVDEGSGVLVEPGDPVALAGAVADVWADGAKRRRLGEGARARSERFTASSVVPSIEAVYDGRVRESV
jgi:glycosyltransferase involved in cell wall biosynthesis